jgi:hypothetical protein
MEKLKRKVIKRSRMDERKLIMEDEIYTVLALLILLSIIPKPSLKTYFSCNPLVAMPIFGCVNSLVQSEPIFKFLHFTENSTKGMKVYDGFLPKLKINPILDHLNSQFKILHIPRQNISTDETLTPWKRHLCFKEYLPLKFLQFGVKTFELCESSTGYVSAFTAFPLISGMKKKNTCISTNLSMSYKGNISQATCEYHNRAFRSSCSWC